MTVDLAQRAGALIDHILTRYHETHRRELPGLVVQAQALEALGGAEGLSGELQAMGEALERHMFKEEMRLFPMMEQGGNTLIGLLIDDLQREHVAHGETMQSLRTRLEELSVPPEAAASLASLRRAFDKLASDLAEHARTEDEILFPLFAPNASRR